MKICEQKTRVCRQLHRNGSLLFKITQFVGQSSRLKVMGSLKIEAYKVLKCLDETLMRH